MSARSLLALALACALAAACGDRQPAVEDGVVQTKLPGHITAGGGSSGQVIAASGSAPIATQPAGTPGIPQGAGGTPGGTAMGGTTVAQAQSAPGGATHPAGDRLGGAGSIPAAAPPIQAEQQARSLAASMDAVAARWRARAAAQGWPTHAATPVEAMAGIQSSATQAAPAGQPQGQLTQAGAQAPVRSEKLGTAPPSTDVKQATKPRTPAVLDPKSPESATPKP